MKSPFSQYGEKPLPVSEPVEKTLTVLEHIDANSGTPLMINDLFTKTQIPKATLYRILTTLVARGYVIKEGHSYRANFHIERRQPPQAVYLNRADAVINDIVARTSRSAEIMTVDSTDLYWYAKAEPPDSAIRIVAKKGFRRTLYELDAPSRIYLRHIGIDEMALRFDRNDFHASGPEKSDHRRLRWDEAADIIRSTDPLFAYDLRGNSNGIRRFVTRVLDARGAFLCLIAIAEAALMTGDESSIAARYAAALSDARTSLING
ncbi:MAG: helix-turn-helix domain-containing protein [Spirochaetota bacterium]